MDTEQFIRDGARRGLSKQTVREALGVSYGSFCAMLEAMPPIAWVGKGKSLTERMGYESVRGCCSAAKMEHIQRIQAERKARSLHTVGESTGTIEELSKLHGVSYSTVRRRMSAGMSLVEALTTPVMKSMHHYRKFHTRGPQQ